MNKETRAQLEQYHNQIVDIISAIRQIGEDEQEKYDNAPENLQYSERVQMWQECADAISSVCDDLENATDSLMDDVISVY